MQSVKEKILTLIKNLPNDASYDDIMEALCINHKINIGIEQLENGNSLTLSQLRERKKLDKEYEFKEQMGWLSLAEQTLQELWNNKDDDEIWSNYL